MGNHVFISYSRADETKVRKLYHDLIQRGVDCWLDVECIQSGADWDKELQQAIESCAHFIVVCTSNSMASQNVQAEWQYAFELKKRLHPIVLEPCEVPFRLRIYQHVDAVKLGYEQALHELAAVLPTTSATEAPVADIPEQPVSQKLNALLKRAVENWRAFGLLLDRQSFVHINQAREMLEPLDAATLELIFLSARHNGQPLDYWVVLLKQNKTALDRIEDALLDEIDYQFSYTRQQEFALLASDSLIAKVTQLIELTNDLAKIELLLDAVERVLLNLELEQIDSTGIENLLFTLFERTPNKTLARALGWIDSDKFLNRALEVLKGKPLSVIDTKDYGPYLYGLAYMRQPDAIAYLQTFTPEGFGFIPAGWFEMGTDTYVEEFVFAHDVFVPGFWLAKTLVTEQEYSLFSRTTTVNIEATGKLPTYPISWLNARRYTRWIADQLGLPVSLPTEAMWEKAASWQPAEGRKLRFPWGDEPDPSRCNSVESGRGSVSPVGMFSPQGDSPYGMQDMVGNVWEWTSSMFNGYPYHARDGREQSAGDRVLRGSSYYARRGFKNGCTTRIAFAESYAFHDAGFRVAIVIAQ
ncbi:MAG: SUMF1/EgtB/PvdO family nonheme iron enzyme [Chloroflexota bacterium]